MSDTYESRMIAVSEMQLNEKHKMEYAIEYAEKADKEIANLNHSLDVVASTMGAEITKLKEINARHERWIELTTRERDEAQDQVKRLIAVLQRIDTYDPWNDDSEGMMYNFLMVQSFAHDALECASND